MGNFIETIDEMPNDQLLGKCSSCLNEVHLSTAIEEWDGFYSGCCEAKLIIGGQ